LKGTLLGGISTHVAVSGLRMSVPFRTLHLLLTTQVVPNSINLVAIGQKLNEIYLKKTEIADAFTPVIQCVIVKFHTHDSSSNTFDRKLFDIGQYRSAIY